MLGLVILISFIIIALAAPLITPYSPVRDKPTIASFLAKPIWYKYLPLGEDLSENIEAVQTSDLNTPTSLEQLEFTTNASARSSLEFASDIGKTENGCAAIVFEREETEAPRVVFTSLTKTFSYPYKVAPDRFQGEIAVSVEGAENVPIEVTVFIERVGGFRIDWWSQNFTTTTRWKIPSPTIDAYVSKGWLFEKFGSWTNPAHRIFSEPGDYRYGVEMLFNDTRQGEKIEATVYVDDFKFTTFGTAFGLLGSDHEGRDIFTQLIYGTRISLIVGLLAAVLSTAVGLIIGLIAGYLGKYVDEVLMRFTDMLLVIPDTPLYIVLMAVLSPSVWNLILLIAVIGWTGFARVVRSQVISIKERPFIEAARAIGAGKFRVIFRHILPNVMSLVYVTLALSVPYAITSEAWLSWLGLYDPYVMTWGRMLYDSQATAVGIRMWWWVVPPGICIALISLSFILLGYALDEILNPKLRKRQ
jgi:ABC-type dipeptide/oligopeptide/nickel transport system permease subunit